MGHRHIAPDVDRLIARLRAIPRDRWHAIRVPLDGARLVTDENEHVGLAGSPRSARDAGFALLVVESVAVLEGTPYDGNERVTELYELWDQVRAGLAAR